MGQMGKKQSIGERIMSEWFKRQLRKITAFVLAFYLALVTWNDEKREFKN